AAGSAQTKRRAPLRPENSESSPQPRSPRSCPRPCAGPAPQRKFHPRAVRTAEIRRPAKSQTRSPCAALRREPSPCPSYAKDGPARRPLPPAPSPLQVPEPLAASPLSYSPLHSYPSPTSVRDGAPPQLLSPGSRAKLTFASAATTAVSVRKISFPIDASANAAFPAAANSPSVHPPSGPMAKATLLAALPCNTSRNGAASGRSDSITFNSAGVLENPFSVLSTAASSGTFPRRDCCDASSKILFHRSPRLPAAAINAFSLLPAASGTIRLTPSSVAFSSAHSNESNFTRESKSVISSAGETATICSTRTNSIRSHPALSIRPSHTLSPSLSS